MSYRYSGGFETHGGTDDAPDYIYYNATIINNAQTDQQNGLVLADPAIRFNETRDKALLTHSADYHFSIIRFTMNGANLDLPLFCPQIQGVYAFDLYSVATPLFAVGQFVSFNSADYQCLLSNGTAVAGVGVQQPATYPPATNTYWGLLLPNDPNLTVYSFACSAQQKFTTQATAGTVNFTVTAYPSQLFMNWSPQYKNTQIAPIPPDNNQQNIGTSRYYWASDYSYVCSLMNLTLQQLWVNLHLAWVSAWNTAIAGIPGATITNPYATFTQFVAGFGAYPYLTFDGAKKTFQLYADSTCFGQRLLAFPTTTPPAVGAISAPYGRLFMNNNMYGLLSGFSTIYWNSSDIPSNYPEDSDPSQFFSPFPPITNVEGFTQEFVITNSFYSNVADYRAPPYASQASSYPSPLGYVPSPASGQPLNLQKPYYVVSQNWSSVDTLWSPILNISFQSTLLPLVRENDTQPTYLGQGNLGNSAPTARSAFAPIITDIAIDQSTEGSNLYRKFIYYAPQAEYRITDTAGDQEIRNIDISVFWKCRLDNQYYPVQMFNLSSVSLKAMFRKKTVGTPKVDH
jgi:hypothetical protein